MREAVLVRWCGMRIKLNDTTLFVDVAGSCLVAEGPAMRDRPVVLTIHGGPGFDHSHLKPYYAGFADVAQVVFFDQRGTGRSERGSPEHWNLVQWADDIHALCQTLGIERPIVVGVSAGGFVAMTYATRYPDGLAKMVLSGSAANMRLDRMITVFERLGGVEAARVAERFWTRPDDVENVANYLETCFPLYYQTPQDPHWIDRAMVNSDLLGHFYKPGGEGFRFDLLPDLAKVRCPTLVLTGAHDPVTPAQQAADIAAAIPAHFVRYECFAHCGHTPERDDPEAVGALLRGFFAA